MGSKIEISQETVQSIKELYENTKLGHKKIAEKLSISIGVALRVIRENEFKKEYKHPVNNLSRDYLEELYINQNKSITEIGKITGISRPLISRKLKEYEIPIKHVGCKPIGFTKEDLIELYINQGLSQKEIADYYGCSLSTLTKPFKKFNILKRNKGISNETLRDLFLNKKMTIKEIAEKLGYRKNTIIIRLKDMNLLPYTRTRMLCEEELLKLVLQGASMKQIRTYFKCSERVIKSMLKEMGINSQFKGVLDNVSRETFYKLIILENKTLKEIGEIYSVSDSTIKVRLTDLNFNVVKEKWKYLKEQLPKEKLEELYLIKELSQDEIASQFNVGRCRIDKLLKEYNIKKEDKYKEITKEILIELYVNQNLPPCIIAKKLNVHPSIIKNRVSKWFLNKLKTKEQIQQCKNKAYEVTLRNYRSKGEKEIEEAFPTPYHNTHSIINLELDLWYPEKNVAIEYNGDYWHSIKFPKNSGLHIAKFKICKSKGIHLINIFERDWSASKSRNLIRVLLTRFLTPEKLLKIESNNTVSVSRYQRNKFEEAHNILGKGYSELAVGIKGDNNELLSCLSYKLINNRVVVERFTTNSKYLEDYTNLINYLKEKYNNLVTVKYDNRYYYKFPAFLTPIEEKNIEPQLYYVKSRKALRKEEATSEYLNHSKCIAVYDCGFTEVTY